MIRWFRVLTFLSGCAFLVHSLPATGQEIRTRISRDTILIGDTLHVTLEVKAAKGADVLYSVIPDTLSGGLELFSAPRLDTLLYGDSGYVSRLLVPITAYDSGWFYIPRIPVLILYNGVTDTLHSDGRPLYVSLIPPEEGVEDILPIRGPLAQRITLAEMLPWLLGAMGLLGLGIGLYYWLRYRKRRRDGVNGEVFDPRSPYEIAMERLQALQAERAWRNLGIKGYFTELTETLRVYLASKWNVRTMEETTENIVAQLKRLEVCDAGMVRAVQDLLSLGDLAKFARFAPEESECLGAVSRAIELVESVEQLSPQPPESAPTLGGSPLPNEYEKREGSV